MVGEPVEFEVRRIQVSFGPSKDHEYFVIFHPFVEACVDLDRPARQQIQNAEMGRCSTTSESEDQVKR